MTENIVVPQSPTTPGVIVSEGNHDYGHRGLEAKDSTFFLQSQLATSAQLQAKDSGDYGYRLLSAIKDNHSAVVGMTKDIHIAMLERDSRRGEQLVELRTLVNAQAADTKYALALMEARGTATSLQDAKDEIQLLKIKSSSILS